MPSYKEQTSCAHILQNPQVEAHVATVGNVIQDKPTQLTFLYMHHAIGCQREGKRLEQS